VIRRYADQKVNRRVPRLVEAGMGPIGGGGGSGGGGSGGEGRSVEFAVELISRMLRLRPEERPTMGEVLCVVSLSAREMGAVNRRMGLGQQQGAFRVRWRASAWCAWMRRARTCSPRADTNVIMGGKAENNVECPNCRTKVEGVSKVFG
jgi:hypothetical protein